MNAETMELLLECKKAGYEFIAIGVVDKRVPISKEIEKQGERKYCNHPSGGDYWGEIIWKDPNTGKKIVRQQAKVVCAAPNRRDSGFPAIWKICEESTLTAGLSFRGCGFGESHEVRANHNLEKGCYDLKEIN